MAEREEVEDWGEVGGLGLVRVVSKGDWAGSRLERWAGGAWVDASTLGAGWPGSTIDCCSLAKMLSAGIPREDLGET
jgi:hypothetical protein